MELPDEPDDSLVGDLRARLSQRRRRSGHLRGRDALVESLPESFAPEDRQVVAAVAATLSRALVDEHEERLALAGTANLARFGQGFETGLESAAGGARGAGRPAPAARRGDRARRTLTVRIGHENAQSRPVGHVDRRHRLRPGGTGTGQLGVRRPHQDGLPRNDGRGARRGALRQPDPGPEQLGELGQRGAYDRLLRGARRLARRVDRRDQEGVPPARAPAPPRRQPGSADARAVQGGHERLRGAVRRRASARCTTSAATRWPVATARGRLRGGLLASPTSWTPSSGHGGAARGPRSRVRRGQDALVRLEVDLAEAAFGATRDLQVDTAIVCATCQGAGTVARHAQGHLSTSAPDAARSARCSGRSSVRS